jgi:hypothetical protein
MGAESFTASDEMLVEIHCYPPWWKRGKGTGAGSPLNQSRQVGKVCFTLALVLSFIPDLRQNDPTDLSRLGIWDNARGIKKAALSGGLMRTH